jgi:glutamate/tyrosine decarboxylase-like PLP-dependent enzyme
MTDVLARLRAMQAHDLPVTGGRTLAYVYDSGLADLDQTGRAAVAAYAGSNGLDPTAFPSLLAMENDLVGFAAHLFDAGPEAVGTVTSGGTESVLLAVLAARDAHPEVDRPRMVLPTTIHACFHKAARLFGVEPVFVPVGPDFRADPVAMAQAVDADLPRTVLVAASAPSYAQGVVDPIPDIAALALARGIRCHVDACIGGWVLPYAARLGRAVTPWNFAVPGVTSISADLHKYGYAPKGSSVLLHRSPGLRRPQFYATADWPGYTVINSTLQSTKSGGPLAGAWAVVQSLGDDGYLRLAGDAFAAVDQIVAGVAGIPGLRVLTPPDSTLITLVTETSCDPFTVCDEMVARGWFVQPQMRYGDWPATIHLSVSASTLAHVDECLAALSQSVAAAVQAGPVTVPAPIAAYLGSVDPAGLTEAEFDTLLGAAGLVGADQPGLVMPTRMAGVNAMLDLATPAVREALMVAFLDRLTRPARGLPTPTSPRT